MESTTTSKASARYAHRRFTHLDFSGRAFAALYSHIYTVVAMVDLDAIEQRVRATIRETKGKDVIERIISEDDFEALMRAARGRAAQHAVPAVVLRKFRDFVTREATQWTLNGSHHNPIWQRVAEALDAVGLNDVPICRVCDALDREHAWASSNLCTACAQKAGGDAVLDQSGAMPDTRPFPRCKISGDK